MAKLTVFDIRIVGGEKTICTDKIHADRMVLDALFCDEVEFTYKKSKMTEDEYELALENYCKKETKDQIAEIGK